MKAEIFPPTWVAGAKLFNAGDWWEAHEAWESEWRESLGEKRWALQGLILLSAALHKRWRMGSQTHRNFYKAQVYLHKLPPQAFGVNWKELEQQVWESLQADADKPPRWPQLWT